MAPLRTDEQVGRVLDGRYRLTRLLGTGASAHVYVADDVRLRRRVAVKVLHPALASDQAFLRRFTTEAQVVGALRHPNIGRVYDWGDDEGAPFLVMELLEGGSLRALLDTGYLMSPAQVLRLGIEAGSALDHAHRRGLVHRDVKPANLIFDEDGRVSVADFGLARALAESTWTEPAGAVVGTARYAAPEQVRGHALDARADVYALALVLVEAATGRVPFATDTTLGTLMARVEHPLDVGADLGPLTPILEAAGTVDPADRLDAAGLVKALQALADRVPPPAPLPLAEMTSARVPAHDADPTEIPGGRPVPFDIDLLDRSDGTPAAAGLFGDADDTTRADLGQTDATAATDVTDVTAAATRVNGVSSRAEASDPTMVAAPTTPAAADAGGGAAGARQAPEAEGERPRRRWRLRIALIVAVVVVLVAAAVGVFVATRPPPSHPVPALAGETEAAARQALAPLHLHLKVGAQTYSPTVKPGTVIAQTPAIGRLREGKAVTVTLSEGPKPIAVPTLTGQTQAAATAAITAARLKLGAVTQATSMTVPQGDVISANPDHGTLLPGGSIALVVSSGKPTVPVPHLYDSAAASYSGAQAAITALGLLVSESEAYSNTVPAGAVIGTYPGPGFPAPVGSTIVVDVSKGPDLVVVPNVVGATVAAASAELSSKGFTVSGVTGNPTAKVTKSSPAANAKAVIGSAVQLVTS